MISPRMVIAALGTIVAIVCGPMAWLGMTDSDKRFACVVFRYCVWTVVAYAGMYVLIGILVTNDWFFWRHIQ